jgi:hypothetical protein
MSFIEPSTIKLINDFCGHFAMVKESVAMGMDKEIIAINLISILKKAMCETIDYVIESRFYAVSDISNSVFKDVYLYFIDTYIENITIDGSNIIIDRKKSLPLLRLDNFIRVKE